jgi:thermostable 8-oxoguanine DNA glycosylase
MIDSFDLSKPWTQKTIEEWFLFGICVAGKGARQTQTKLGNFLDDLQFHYCKRSPFELVKVAVNNGTLLAMLQKHKMGQYARIKKAFEGMIQINPRKVTLEQLEAIHGVGPKTARMLLLYTRPSLEVIPLDTHILKWLRAHGYNAPKSTPSAGPKYRELELAFIKEGRKRKLSPKEWDTIVWKHYAERKESNEARTA